MRSIHAIWLAVATACTASGGASDSGTADTGGSSGGAADFGESVVDDPLCAEDYSLCGDIVIPADFAGTPRSLAIALYTSIPPAGPPAAVLGEIAGPDLQPGARFPVVVQPVTAQGSYYLWFNLYMEGGGNWVPVNDIDYTGYAEAPFDFEGPPIVFEPIQLEVASGW